MIKLIIINIIRQKPKTKPKSNQLMITFVYIARGCKPKCILIVYIPVEHFRTEPNQINIDNNKF